MPGVSSPLEPLDDNLASNAYNLLFLLTGLVVATYAIARFAESHNHLNYDNRFARILAGGFLFIINTLHTSNGDMQIPNDAKLIAVGPHRTGWEGGVVAAKMQDSPPHFFATTAYNSVPGIAFLLKTLKTIPIEAKAIKGVTGKSAHEGAFEEASKVLKGNGCVALFPQGNMAKIDQDPPRVYPGAAKLAIQNKIPLHVIRLDGFWCLENSFIPQLIRNNSYYRAIFSFFSVNNIRTTLCGVIDFHLKPENEKLSDNDKIEEMCAQMYAYYRQTKELTAEEIDGIKNQISNKTHNRFWNNKMEQEGLKKELLNLKTEEIKLEQSLAPL
jgi:1-acyl-sn-glycerol-3-phosphate acyltransferase